MNYEQLLSPTVRELKPSGIRKFFDIASTMQGVISLGVGEPDFSTPWEVRKAGILALETGKTRYTSNRGLEPLRREIARYVERKYGVSYQPETEVLVQRCESQRLLQKSCAGFPNAGTCALLQRPALRLHLLAGPGVSRFGKRRNGEKVLPSAHYLR